MERKDIDWGNLGFGYVQTDMRYVSNFRNGQWDDGCLTDQATITMSECACVLQYAQTCFEGLKAYTTEDGRIVCFRPDLNAQRMASSCRRLKMPVFPEDRFVQAVVETVRANSQWVPPYGSGATLYVRPFMFGSDAIIGVKPATEYQFRVFVTPVGPYFKGGIKPLKLRISDLDRAAPKGTGDVKAGLNYAMSLYNIVDAHEKGYDENVYVGLRHPHPHRGDRRRQPDLHYQGRQAGHPQVRHHTSLYHPAQPDTGGEGLSRHGGGGAPRGAGGDR